MENHTSVIDYATGTEYSKLIWWELYNFMSIPYAKCEFDEKGVINIKGYNDSGKSNLLRALDVAINNRFPANQAKFIRDDEDFFDIRVCFSDGVLIRKVKYIDGKGLYEMYKNKELIFTTQQNGVLTRISGVPQIIQDYLGLINYGDIFLNSRACYEKQLLVETTGSENYKFLNTVLHSEELALASTLLNTDKNAVLTEKTKLEYELQTLRSQIQGVENIPIAFVYSLEELDKKLDLNEERRIGINNLIDNVNSQGSLLTLPKLSEIDLSIIDDLDKLESLSTKSESIVIAPKLNTLNTEKFDDLVALSQIYGELSSMPKPIKLNKLDTERIDELEALLAVQREMSSLPISPKLPTLDDDKLLDLINLASKMEEIGSYKAKIDENESSLIRQKEELDTLNSELISELAKTGIKAKPCPKCGTLVELEVG